MMEYVIGVYPWNNEIVSKKRVEDAINNLAAQRWAIHKIWLTPRETQCIVVYSRMRIE